MNTRRPLAVFSLLLLGFTAPPSVAGDGVETAGAARFTVVTPNLIRIEYDAGKQFIDGQSWFARNRALHDTHYTAQRDGKTLTIDTGAIKLTYTDDGKPLGADNLQAVINGTTWKAGDTAKTNLGGTLVGLDRMRGPLPLQPGVVTRDGWYVLDDSTTVIAKGDWWQERPASHGTDWYLFGYGQDYKAAIQSLTAISGSIPLPRKNALGMWYSRNYGYTQDQWKQIVGEYHQNDFPLDNLVIDYQWHQKGWTGYRWNTDLLPDAPGLLKWLHDQRLSVTLNEHPDAGVQPTDTFYPAFMKAIGQDPASQKTVDFDAGDKKYLDTFYQMAHVPLLAQGVDFWWLDMGKSVSKVLPSLNGLAMLNEYNTRTTAENGRRGQSFSRWGGMGDQRNPIHFSGDVVSGWSALAFEVPYTSTGGNVGAFFWSHDIGGYRGSRDEEGYTRWVQFGSISATLRSHAAGREELDRRPWKYPTWATDSMRVAFHTRAALIPYFYTCAAQATQTSVPMIRPMYLQHPAEEAAYHNAQQYYFGDNLLAAPITMPGQGGNRVAWQHVWFPGGTWYQYFSGEKFSGPSDVVVAADINEYPLFVRGGVPLPEQPYTERPTTTALTNLVLRCYPGEDGAKNTSQLYEDDGITDQYRSGATATTELSYERHGNDITVRIAPAKGKYDGQPAQRAYTILLPATQQATLRSPSSAKLTYDAATFTNRIELPAAAIDQETVVEFTTADADASVIRKQAAARRLDGLTAKPYSQWTDADRAALSPGITNAVAAIDGVALMAVNQHPYLLGNDIQLRYYNPAVTQPTAGTLTFKSWSMPVTMKDGASIDLASISKFINPADIIAVPGVENRLLLQLNGQPTVAGLDVNSIAYNLGDVALDAHLATSTARGEGVIDAVADGAPGHDLNEWVANADDKKKSVRLSWPQPVTVARVLLYDRPNPKDQVLAGKLTFSDGSSLDVGELANDGKTPADISFAPKSVTWVQFNITKVSEKTTRPGLAEMGVFDH